jgi:hypothetical protein
MLRDAAQLRSVTSKVVGEVQKQCVHRNVVSYASLQLSTSTLIEAGGGWQSIHFLCPKAPIAEHSRCSLMLYYATGVCYLCCRTCCANLDFRCLALLCPALALPFSCSGLLLLCPPLYSFCSALLLFCPLYVSQDSFLELLGAVSTLVILIFALRTPLLYLKPNTSEDSRKKLQNRRYRP